MGAPVLVSLARGTGRVSLVGTWCNDGTGLKPYFLTQGAFLQETSFRKPYPPALTDEEVQSTKILPVENGTMTQEVFVKVLEDVILPQMRAHIDKKYPPESQPDGTRLEGLLLLDGTGVHCRDKNTGLLSDELVDVLVKFGVNIVFLPANTTCKLQPCDVGVFGTFKIKLRQLFGFIRSVHSFPGQRIDFDAWRLEPRPAEGWPPGTDKLTLAGNFLPELSTRTRVFGSLVVLKKFAEDIGEKAARAFEDIGIFPLNRDKLLSQARAKCKFVTLMHGVKDEESGFARTRELVVEASELLQSAKQEGRLEPVLAKVASAMSILTTIKTGHEQMRKLRSEAAQVPDGKLVPARMQRTIHATTLGDLAKQRAARDAPAEQAPSSSQQLPAKKPRKKRAAPTATAVVVANADGATETVSMKTPSRKKKASAAVLPANPSANVLHPSASVPATRPPQPSLLNATGTASDPNVPPPLSFAVMAVATNATSADNGIKDSEHGGEKRRSSSPGTVHREKRARHQRRDDDFDYDDEE